MIFSPKATTPTRPCSLPFLLQCLMLPSAGGYPYTRLIINLFLTVYRNIVCIKKGNCMCISLTCTSIHQLSTNNKDTQVKKEPGEVIPVQALH